MTSVRVATYSLALVDGAPWGYVLNAGGLVEFPLDRIRTLRGMGDGHYALVDAEDITVAYVDAGGAVSVWPALCELFPLLPDEVPLSLHAELWMAGQGLRVPLAGTAEWDAMYEKWVAFSFGGTGT